MRKEGPSILTAIPTQPYNLMDEEDAVELLAWAGFISAVILCLAVAMKIAHYYGVQ